MSRWFRFYSEALEDPKVQLLPGDLFKAWVNVLCIASRCNGNVTFHETAFHLRCNADAAKSVLDELVSAGLLDTTKNGFEPHNWKKRQYKSDTSSERVKRYRKRFQNVSETPPDYRVQKEKEKEIPDERKTSLVLRSDKRWDLLAARYRREKSRPLPMTSDGWYFPNEWLVSEPFLDKRKTA